MANKTLTVLTDEGYNQALYVDGVLEEHDDTIYAGDLEDAAKGEPVVIETATIEGYAGDRWPKTLEEAKPFYV